MSIYYRIELIKVRVDFTMVLEVRIELTADPYQGSVLPLNYIGMYLFYHILYAFNIDGVQDGNRTHIVSVGGRNFIH